jgi:tagatose-1,6-bisphosphate aldolase
MAKNTQVFTKPGKSDIIGGIIMGNQQINNLNKLYRDDNKPSVMIKKLKVIENNSSDKKIQEHAGKAIKLLEKFAVDTPLTEIDRTNLLKAIS